MNPGTAKTFGEICSVVSDTAISSLSDFLWTAIKYLWPWEWIAIVVCLGIWISFEIGTRYTTSSFRSKNGFTPTFNRFVGSGTYLLLQTITFLVLTSALGDLAYCYKWPAALHLLVFWLTHRLLIKIRFWVY